MGDVELFDADVTAHLDPPSFDGSAAVPFPALDYLADAGIEGEAPRARLAFGQGAMLGEVEINEQPLALDPDDWYLVADYQSGFSVSFGPASLSTPGGGSTLVVAPQEPLIYIGGDMAGLLTGGVVQDAALGFSLDGRLPYSPANPLWDGEEWHEFELDGHFYAQGSVQLGRYPVSVAATVFVDADADGDGTTIFEGDDGDIALAADGTVTLGYSKVGFDLSADVAEGSVLYDGSQGENGALYFYGRNGLPRLFDGTPLEVIEPDPTSLEGYAYFQDDDFAIRLDYAARVLGFEMADASLELTDDGIAFAGSMRPLALAVLGADGVSMTGAINSDGDFAFTGTARVNVAGFTFANATATLSNSGLSAGALAAIPALGQAQISGQVQTNGRVDMRGDAQLSPLGFQVVNGTMRATNDSLTVAGRITLPGMGHADINGAATPRSFNLTGRAALSPAGFPMAAAQVAVDNRRAHVNGEMDLRIGRMNVSGDAATNGRFTMTGRGELRPAGFRMANASATVQPAGADVAGRVGLPGIGNVDVRGRVQNNGQFSLTGRADLAPAGVRLAGANVTITPNGAAISGRVGVGGTGINVSGNAHADGRYQMGGGVGVDAGIFRGRVDASLSNAGASLVFTGGACFPVPDPCASTRRVCVPVIGCENVCVPGTRNRCEDVRQNLNWNGELCVNLPVIGRQCQRLL